MEALQPRGACGSCGGSHPFKAQNGELSTQCAALAGAWPCHSVWQELLSTPCVLPSGWPVPGSGPWPGSGRKPAGQLGVTEQQYAQAKQVQG